MQRIFDDPSRVVEDMLTGWLKANEATIAGTDNPRVVRYRAAPIAGKVGLVTGGGSGHEPAFLGYIGEGLMDAVAIGEIFSSPSAQAFYDAFRAADSGKGVACLYGNYAGDNMNVKMAIRLAAADGITVKTVVANDDVPSAPPSEREKRRGVAGEILMWKVGGAKAATGASLDEVIATAQHAIDSTRSVGHRPDALHHPRGRGAELPDRAGHDGGRHRAPRRAGRGRGGTDARQGHGRAHGGHHRAGPALRRR